jgi:glycosyltransferase involved in cell wall biosynthesis
MVTIFWGSIISIAYTYFGYPLILLLLSFKKRHEIRVDQCFYPSVSLIITAHNEAKRIRKKLDNSLEAEYPEDKLEILVASDASTDETDEIVRTYAGRKIKLVRALERKGKEYAQECAIEQAKGEIIVFSDVATMLEKDGIRKIILNFADASIGCVSSVDRFIDKQGQASGEGAYVRYEMWLRSLESKVNSVVGLSGSFFAARKNVCSNWPIDIPSDFNTLLNSIRSGYRGISDPQSIGIYTNIEDEVKEFERKVRTITRGISALMANRKLLNPARYGLFSWQLISHKLLRWIAPWLLMAAFTTNVALAIRRSFYLLILIPHILFYIVGFFGASLAKNNIMVRLPYYFIQVNRAIAVAWFKYLKGERFTTWTPSHR